MGKKLCALLAALSCVSLTRLGGYIRRLYSVHIEESTSNEYIDELLKCCEIIYYSLQYDHL